jgi:hypothetical protein
LGDTLPVTDDTDKTVGMAAGGSSTNDVAIPTIVLLGLSLMVTQSDVFDLFWQCEGFYMADVRFLGNRNDYQNRVGYVVFEDVGSAQRAMEQLRHTWPGDKQLRMHLTKRSEEGSKQK